MNKKLNGWRTVAMWVVLTLAACQTATGPTEGQEGVALLTLDQVHDETRNGYHLILRYDQPTNTFVGTLENVSSAPLTNVRVEIHLSNGVELGPTPRTTVAPGATLSLSLPAPSGGGFTTWSAHAEIG